jgi:hypothetical protein
MTNTKTLAEQIDSMDMLDVILDIEGGDLLDRIETAEDARAVLTVVKPLRYSQGFYSRLCRNLEEFVESKDED